MHPLDIPYGLGEDEKVLCRRVVVLSFWQFLVSTLPLDQQSSGVPASFQDGDELKAVAVSPLEIFR